MHSDGDMTYPFCFSEDETLLHLFLNCTIKVKVWRGIERWLGIEVDLNINCIAFFLRFCSLIRKEIDNYMGSMVWTTT